MVHPKLFRARAGTFGFLSGMAAMSAMAALIALGGVLSGCETVQLGPGTTDDPADTDTSATASLTLMNQRQTDPGTLVFLLYGPEVQDIENVAPAVTLPPVGFEKTITAEVKPGRWKVAYRLASGDLRPMPPEGDEATDSEWPVVSIAKNKSYTILIETDDGGLTTWKYNLPVED